MNGVESDKLLAPLTTIGLGGRARYYAAAYDLQTVVQTLTWAREQGLSVWVLSGGSNIVVSDSGLDGLVLDVRLRGIHFERNGCDRVQATAAAGEDWDTFVNEAVNRGCSGIECLSGIPGRVGATPIQNVGAYGQDVSQTIRSVEVVDRATGEHLRLDARECNFGYRASRFKHTDADRYIVLSVCFSLSEAPPRVPEHRELLHQCDAGPHATAREIRDMVLKLRREKSMIVDDSDPCSRGCGSFFVNPVVPASLAEAIKERYPHEPIPVYPQPLDHVKIAAAWLIEKAGFRKGDRAGLVGISEKHCLAVVTRPGASARDVVGFARKIQLRVQEQFGVWLMPEPIFWGFTRMERGLPVLD